MPAQSGDLQPIDNWWKGMKKRIITSDPGPAETREEFVARVRKVVLSTPADDIMGAVHSMPSRIEACIANKGGRCGY